MKIIFPIVKRVIATAVIGASIAASGIAGAQSVPSHDNLNATYWTQNSVEFRGNALTAYAAATLRMGQALADKNWTAVAEQGDNYSGKPPAIILDVDETVLDNSLYQSWMVLNDETFHPKTWDVFVMSEQSRAIPGSLAFIKDAVSKGVTIFYVSNRTGNLEEATRNNLKALGYPIDESQDTVLLKKEKAEWKSSKKGVRRAHVAKTHRVLLVVGDNLGDFVDGYKGDREAEYKANRTKFGKQWIVVSNATYGSWDSAAFGHNYKKSADEQRQAKRDRLDAWKPAK